MKQIMLPRSIAGRYELYRRQKLLGQSSSKKAIYMDKKTGKLVFIKVDRKGKSLFREYEYQQLFYEQSKKLKTKDIVIPKPLEIIKNNNYTTLVMEYFPGKSLIKADVNTRLDAYMKVLKFLEKINGLTTVKKNGFIKKSSAHQLITLPYFLLKNLSNYFPYASLFLKSFGAITKVTSKWLNLAPNWLCHGDINVGNILLNGKKAIILDFGQSNISHRYFDISRALNSTWYQREFHPKFWDRIIGEFSFAKHQQDILKSFVVFNLLERLSQRYTNPNQEYFYLKRLKNLLTS